MEKHLTDDQVIDYLNNKDNIPEIVLRMIEAHLYIHKCTMCISKMEGIRQLNKKLQMEENEELMSISVCQQSDLVYRYISGEMTSYEKDSYEEHLTVCDDCRELSAVLFMESLSVGQMVNKPENAWGKAKQSIYKLMEPLRVYTDKINGAKITGNMAAYRDSTGISEKGKITLDLPDDYGKVRFQLNKNSKLIIELIELKEKNMLVEVYDSEGHLIKSEEGNPIVSCSVTHGTGMINIDKKYEIPFKIIENGDMD
jgi:hypothetical protein